MEDAKKLDLILAVQSRIESKVDKLDEVVRTGNGKPSLVTQVAVLENRQDNDEATRKQDLKTWTGVVTTLAGLVSGAIALASQAISG